MPPVPITDAGRVTLPDLSLEASPIAPDILALSEIVDDRKTQA